MKTLHFDRPYQIWSFRKNLKLFIEHKTNKRMSKYHSMMIFTRRFLNLKTKTHIYPIK